MTTVKQKKAQELFELVKTLSKKPKGARNVVQSMQNQVHSFFVTKMVITY